MSKPSVRDLSDADIRKRLAESRQELFSLRLQRASGKLTNPARVVLMRRTTARLLTALRERAAGGGE
jgi:large subunit ribosomal protein L29